MLIKPYFQKTKVSPDQGLNLNPESSKKNSRLLPHFYRYIWYAIALIIIFTSAFFVILYSMQWGSTKSKRWLKTVIWSFLADVFLLQNIKIAAISLVLIIYQMKRQGFKNDKVSKMREFFFISEDELYFTQLLKLPDLRVFPPRKTTEDEKYNEKLSKESRVVFSELSRYFMFLIILFSLTSSTRFHNQTVWTSQTKHIFLRG